MKKDRIYLDYCATTPVDPVVLDAMIPYFSGKFGNASSIHSYGRETKIPLEESRETVATLLGAKPGEVFFTSGGTEADNYAVIGASFAARRSAGKNHIIVSAVEHHAVLRSAEYLGANGFDITILPVDGKGRVDPGTLDKAMTARTALVSIIHANNEIGTLQPIRELAGVAHARGVPFHSDTVQSVGKIPVNVDDLGIDILSLSAHKFYGPKGVGAVYLRKGVDIDSVVHGGAQERNRRAGTESLPLVVGLAKALELSSGGIAEETARLSALRAHLRALLEAGFEGVLFNGDESNRIPHLLSVSFDSKWFDLDGEALLLNMDLAGVAVTSGSACSSGSMEPSHVLQAIGRDVRTARASIRFSFGKTTTEEELDRVVEILREVLPKCAAVVH